MLRADARAAFPPWAGYQATIAVERESTVRRVLMTVAVLFTLASAVPFAQVASTSDPMPGTWLLDLTKSRFSPGPAPKSQAATLTAVDGGIRVVADRVEADGKTTHFEWTAKFDGKDYPVTGDPGRDAVSVKKTDRYTLEITNKKAGKVTSLLQAVYTPDGKSRTETTTGTTPQGVKIENVAVWTKQQR
jgi:hypothetical protein